MSEDEPGIRDLIAAFDRFTDAFERLVQLAEDWSNAVDLPVSDRRSS